MNQFSAKKSDIQLKAIAKPNLEGRKKNAKQDIACNTVFACEKILNTFGIRQRPWRGELTRGVENLLKKA